jgi:hypothetical protein
MDNSKENVEEYKNSPAKPLPSSWNDLYAVKLFHPEQDHKVEEAS